MAHVPEYNIHIRRGEDWEVTADLSEEGAPDDFDGWAFYMQIRKRGDRSVVAALSLGDGITVVEGAENPTIRLRIPKEETVDLPAGTPLVHDLLVVPPETNAFWFWEGRVTVTHEVTNKAEFGA